MISIGSSDKIVLKAIDSNDTTANIEMGND